MKLTISYDGDQVISIDISQSMSLEDLQAYLEAETSIAPLEQILILNSKTLRGGKSTLEELGIQNDDLIVLHRSHNIAAPSASVSAPTTASYPDSSSSSAMDNQIELMRQQLLSNPQLRSNLAASNPQVESVLDNPDAFKRVMQESLQQFQNGDHPSFSQGLTSEQQQEISRLEQDPDNPDNQARILEIIRQEQINKNMELAYDITPESFTSVSMLYIKIKVNGQPVQAFVDSGAQQTIISPRLAEKVGIDRLIDKRFVGEARGVGTTKVLGKIHSVPIRIGDSNIDIPCSFMIIDTLVDLLFGLDMLKRHKCIIDLANNKLVVGGNIETPFLADNEIENNDLLGRTVGGNDGNANLGFGGNIFSDPPSSSSALPAKKKPASSAAADAAAKRQNLSGPSGSSSSSRYKDEDILQLIGLGFTRDEVIKALDACQGNVEIAASYLFQ